MTAKSDSLTGQIVRKIAENGLTWSQARLQLLEENPSLRPEHLPDDEQIESGLREHYAIFDPQGHAERLKELRETALRVMRAIQDFSPVVTRGVVNGCADKYSNIYIEVVCDDPKAFEIFLLDKNIDFESHPCETNSVRDPVEEVIFEAPLLKNGYFRQNNFIVWVSVRIFCLPPQSKKQKKFAPDPWQIELETQRCLDIEQLERLICLKQQLS